MYTYIILDIGGNLIVLYIGVKVVAKVVLVITTVGPGVVRCNINSTAVQPQHDALDPN